MADTFIETPNQIEVYDECDILVVGGGAAGHSAAVAAARAGARKVVLLERYGYFGGDATGGYVLMVPKLSWRDRSFVRGLQEEWFTRLAKIPDAALIPDFEDLGKSDPELIERWQDVHGCVHKYPDGTPYIVRAGYFEPNQLKIEMDKMLTELKEQITVYCHCWAAKPIMDGSKVTGVIFESKEGRKAIKAKVVIDASGDGDIFRQTGAPYSDFTDSETRCSTTAIVYRAGGVDFKGYCDWRRANPEAARALSKKMNDIAGFRVSPFIVTTNDIVWFNNWVADMDCSKIKDLTTTELLVRDSIRDIIALLKETVPEAWGNAFLYDIAPQLGARCSYRLEGEYVITPDDFAFHREFDDVIAWHSTICQINDCAPVEIPYRAMLPKKVDNLLCPGRHLSADPVAIDWVILIPQCIGTGQACGVAAAVAVADGTTVREVDIKKVQDILVDQDVPLPRHPKTDPSLLKMVEENDYGLYTELAKAAREDKEKFGKYRQW